VAVDEDGGFEEALGPREGGVGLLGGGGRGDGRSREREHGGVT
jgi:hypothetical protein